jgi:hypothetical protein
MPNTTTSANYVTKHRSVRGPSNLPQTATGALFTITGTIKVFDVEGEVTTAVAASTNNLKYVHTPTIGSATDICAVTDFNAAAVGTHMNITGTFATAMVKSANGAHVGQAAATVLTAGTLGLSASASTTGATKQTLVWEPLTADGSVTPTAVT